MDFGLKFQPKIYGKHFGQMKNFLCIFWFCELNEIDRMMFRGFLPVLPHPGPKKWY